MEINKHRQDKQLDTIEKSLSNISYHLHRLVEVIAEKQCTCNKNQCCNGDVDYNN